ncbi:MAG: lysyl oxidase family protein [Myxococcota bacterium]|nr:lysyl oxidase family protein [Myxococcota bacterium]
MRRSLVSHTPLYVPHRIKLVGVVSLFLLGCQVTEERPDSVEVCGNEICAESESSTTCPEDCGALCADVDGDEVCDLNDNCPTEPNLDQSDIDMDGAGDACDICPDSELDDADGDGICGNVDNCPDLYNINQADSDEDGIGNGCDPCPILFGGDMDSDGTCDAEDNCPSDANEEQLDTDGDLVGDACDPCLLDNPDDLDGDGVCVSADICRGGDDTVDINEDGVPDACENCGFVDKRQYVITYEGVYTYNGQGPFTFQVVLDEFGDIVFQYNTMHNYAEATIGIESPPDAFAMQYYFDTINVQDETRILYRNLGDIYEVVSTREIDGPPYEWIEPVDAEEITEMTSYQGDDGPPGDEGATRIDLPFSFPFRGQSYDALYISTNGYLWSGGSWTSTCCRWESEELPTERNWELLIAPLWTDLNLETAGRILLSEASTSCQQDCAGDWDGFARLDDCEACTGGSTGITTNRDKDCEGICFGEAYLDTCGQCAGGTTEHIADSDDVGCGCFEPPAGIWYPDSDGDGLGYGLEEESLTLCRLEAPLGFVDNNDDEEPDCPTNDTLECGSCGAKDCTGLCDGGAIIDPCNRCAGGNTDIEPARPDDENEDGIPDDCSGPDLTIDTQYMKDTTFIDYVYVDPSDCYIQEGCVGGPGLRKVLRFGTMVGNIGNEDLAIGFPGGGEDWVYAICHDHYHFEDYAYYELITAEGRQITTVGYKNGWCVMDLANWGDDDDDCTRYNCNNQGITAGCADIYASSLDCQWIDITSILDGEYTVRVTTNPYLRLYELDYSNNVAEMTVRLDGDEVTILPDPVTEPEPEPELEPETEAESESVDDASDGSDTPPSEDTGAQGGSGSESETGEDGSSGSDSSTESAGNSDVESESTD